MKLPIKTLSMFAALLAIIPTTVTAVNSTLQPISTRYAQTQDAISIEAAAWSFSDFDLEESEDFDGWSAGAEIVVPIPRTTTMQLRLSIPFYTDGDATLIDESLPDVGEKIDIDGNGGIYEFATLQFEHQLFNIEEDGFNAAYVFGGGTRTSSLDTTASDDDVYNHTGDIIVAGVKYDRPIFDGKAHWLVNAGARFYMDTDDLHVDDEVDFTFADFKTAVVFNDVCEHFVPVVELTYLGDFDYNIIALQPEVIVPINEHVSFKLGGIVSLSDDGNQGGGIASLAIGF